MRAFNLQQGKVNIMAYQDTRYFTRAQVARIFQVSPLSIMRWEKSGQLKSIKLGAGSIRIPRESVQAFIAAAAARP